ncbi:glucokinase [Undibacterium sp. SXout7W]|uniref:glucokinase n=1 Tax=Undibacterium sp. SXout7W TaxID=3413049 RepID=UPI003BF25999
MSDEKLVQELRNVSALAPRLLADVGGTNARFALEVRPHCFEAVSVLACNAYPDIYSAICAYLENAAVRAVLALHPGVIEHAAIAIANPVDGDLVTMTNHHWTFSVESLRHALELKTLLVVNDFTALAMALPHLSGAQRQQIGEGVTQANRVIGLIGPGTGLGVSGIIPAGAHWVPLSSEGGHVTFAPASLAELELMEKIWVDYPHISAERLISGMGLELIYQTLMRSARDVGEDQLPAAEITRRALSGDCGVCIDTVSHFCAMLGTVAGNLALTLGATGGIYIGGGIVPRLGQLFAESAFRQRFEAKGRFADYLANIPTYVITAQYPAFLGVSVILSEKLAAAHP